MNAVCVFQPNLKTNIQGWVRFHQKTQKSPCFVAIELHNLSPNSKHGIHIHRYGDLTQGCASTCEHYNPTGERHGSQLLHGTKRHAGDLFNNVMTDKHGFAKLEFIDPMIQVSDILGRSIVLHQDADDLGALRDLNTQKGQESAKSGNAGKRIACAIIGLGRESNNC